MEVPKIDAGVLQGWLQNLTQEQITWVGLSLVVLIWLVWSIAKKIVRLGYFLIALVVGCVLALGVAAATGQPLQNEGILASGMSFAFLWTSIRAKIARVVTALTVGTVLSLGAHHGWDKLIPAAKPADTTPVKKAASAKGDGKKVQKPAAK